MSRTAIIIIVAILMLVYHPHTLASTLLTFTENSSSSLSTSPNIGAPLSAYPIGEQWYFVNTPTIPGSGFAGLWNPTVMYLSWVEPENPGLLNVIYLIGTLPYPYPLPYFSVSSEVHPDPSFPLSAALPDGGVFKDVLTQYLPTGSTPIDVAFIDAAAESEVPEPSTMLLVGSGLVGLAGLWRKFRK